MFWYKKTWTTFVEWGQINLSIKISCCNNHWNPKETLASNQDENGFDHDWLNNHWREVTTLVGGDCPCVWALHFQFQTFSTIPRRGRNKKDKEAKESARIREWLVGGKSNGNHSRNRAFWSERALEVIFITIRWGTLHIFFSPCFALTRRDTAVAEGQLRMLLVKRRETTVGFTRTPASGLPEFHQSLFKWSCSGAHLGQTGASVDCRGWEGKKKKLGSTKITSAQMNAPTFSADRRIAGVWGSAILEPTLSFMWERFGEEGMLRLQKPHPQPEPVQHSILQSDCVCLH